MHSDSEGAFVYIYVPASDLERSIEKMKSLVNKDNFILKDIEYVRKVDLEEWEEENNTESPTLADMKEALMKDIHLYSTFNSYQSEYEH